MKRLILKGVLLAQAHRVMRLWHRDRVAVLMYHGLSPTRRGPGIENYQGKHLYVGAFEQHLQHLQRHYNVIPLDRLIEHCEQGTPLPPRSVVLTFDDGYESVCSLGLPLLLRYGLPASTFVVTDFVDRQAWLWMDRIEYALNTTTRRTLEVEMAGGRRIFPLHTDAEKSACDSALRSWIKSQPQDQLPGRVAQIEAQLDRTLESAARVPDLYRPMTWAQVNEMLASSVMSIGSHTATHVIVGRCSDAQAAEELARSRQQLEERTGKPCTQFCYPNGRVGDFTARTGELLRRTGYRCGLTTVSGLNDAQADIFAVRRLATGDGDLDRFQLTVAGVMEHLDALRHAGRRRAPHAAATSHA